MQSTMQEVPLTITALMRHGLALYGSSEVVTLTADGSQRTSFSEVGRRSAQLAHALTGLGVGRGTRVGTFMWNNAVHVEAYLAIPCMGAVLHTINIRLFPEQITYVVNHAEDRVIIVNHDLLDALLTVLSSMPTVAHVIVVGASPDAATAGPVRLHGYEELIADAGTEFEWPADLDERSAAAVCYTSGTTGDPKGVVYSHRSTYLHTIGVCVGNVYGLTERDRVVPVVPMFHANAWGLPYAAWVSGADLLMPDRHLQAAPLCRFIREERATIASGVPTVWNDLLRYAESADVDLSSMRMLVAGGSAVPVAMMQAFRSRFGVTLIQGWGMTETSPVAALALPPKDADPDDEWAWRARTGRMVAGVECRIVDDSGAVLPTDGVAVGEFECRGPWVTGSYYAAKDAEKFSGGWLRTGDVGTLDDRGFMQITDRSKDLIKSGGEWISSVDLENELMAHPGIAEAAVVAVPDVRWQERPLAVVVTAAGHELRVDDLREFLGMRVARWQVPERWAFVAALPRTSVGKFDKKMLRTRYSDGGLDVIGEPVVTS